MNRTTKSSEVWQPIPKKPSKQLIGLGVAMVLPWAWPFLTTALTPEHSDALLPIALGLRWATVLVVILIVIAWERESPSTIGISNPSGADLVWALALGGASFGGSMFILPYGTYIYRDHRRKVGSLRVSSRDAPWVIGALLAGVLLHGLLQTLGGRDGQVAASLADFSTLWKLAFIATAAVTEEILFRGYAIERLYALTGRLWLSAGISFVIFTAGHIPGEGLAPVLSGTSLVAAGLTLLYLRTRNLPACILLHFLLNLTIFLT